MRFLVGFLGMDEINGDFWNGFLEWKNLCCFFVIESSDFFFLMEKIGGDFLGMERICLFFVIERIDG